MFNFVAVTVLLLVQITPGYYPIGSLGTGLGPRALRSLQGLDNLNTIAKIGLKYGIPPFFARAFGARTENTF